MKKKGFLRVVKNNLFMLKYVFRYVPLYATLHLILQMLFGLFDVMWGIVIMKIVVDAVMVTHSFGTVAIAMGIYILYGATIQIWAAYMYEVYAPIQKEKLNKAMNEDLYQKAVQMDYACYSNTGFYNDFVWAASQCEGKANDVLDIVSSFLKSFVTVSGITAVMFYLEKIGILFVLASVAVSFLLRLLLNRIGLKKAEESKPFERKRDYINRVFYLADYAKEMRMHQLKDNLTEEYQEANRSLRQIIKRYAGKFIAISLASDYFFGTFLLEVLLLYILAYKTVVVGSLLPGSFAAVQDGLWTLKWSMNNLILTFSQFQEKSLYIEKFRGFLDYENKLVSPKDPLPVPAEIGTLVLEDVSFTYEGCKEPTLRHISMEIKPKEKIAIVGYNGAGKSTLIKLITRLYDVSEGIIRYDGTDIRQYDLKDYYTSFGSVFQDHQLFAGSLLENVLMDVNQDMTAEADQSALAEKALAKAGFSDKLAELPEGLNSEMTKEFHENGLILSGGETQKVAISRVFANEKAKILILDEPSSALDPLSEFNLNQTMLEAATEKTVIFISHRLSTTKMADRIYMMENGSVIECGSHEELMEQDGKYAEMFRLQAENYAILQ